MGKGTKKEDTIAAISTPLGEGGIGIIRISGPDSYSILLNIFKPQTKTPQYQSHRLYFGLIEEPETKAPIDQVLAAYMKAPKSYTGEDVVEISCHGGTAVLKKALSAILSAGARIARPGEFTKRAFLNGRLDLAQAEAVIDLIKARTPECARAASDQLLGGLSDKVKELREALLKLLAGIEASIDFPDDIKVDLAGMRDEISGIQKGAEELLKTSDAGSILRDGIPAVILGKPNAGKSSLMNALLKYDRAIVSEDPGTTRDTIEEAVNIKGLPLRIVDTAGMREVNASVEQAGVLRAKEAASSAGLLIVVLDASLPLTEEDELVLSHARRRRAVIVLNKTDKPEKVNPSDVKGLISKTPIFKVSALYGDGVGELEEGIFELLTCGTKLEEDTMVLNLRHKNCLIRAIEALGRAGEAMGEGLEEEAFSIDLREAAAALGEVTGEAVSEEVIDLIFSEFCVGK